MPKLFFDETVVPSLNKKSAYMMSMIPDVKYYSMGVYKNSAEEYEQPFYVPMKDCLHIASSMPNIHHEMAHMLEMRNISRLTLPDMGMKMPVWSNGNADLSFAMTAREIRVLTIQGKFSEHISYFGNRRTDNPVWQESLKAKIPFGRFKTWKDVLDWEEDLQTRTSNAWNEDRIMHEWKVRVDYIRNWMETKEDNSKLSN